jgi:hypothetical protein
MFVVQEDRIQKAEFRIQVSEFMDREFDPNTPPYRMMCTLLNMALRDCSPPTLSILAIDGTPLF